MILEATNRRNQRLLIIDDNPVIHEDIRKVLSSGHEVDEAFAEDDSFLFGDKNGQNEPVARTEYLIDSAYQGQEGLQLVRTAIEQQQPYPVAIVDMRMPPGWDGLETVQHLWQADPDLLVIFCTAFSDYTWTAMVDALGMTDRFVILKKPFDNAEMQQLVAAMTERWHAARDAAVNVAELHSILRSKALLEKRIQDLEALVERLQNHAENDPSIALSETVLVVDTAARSRRETADGLTSAGANCVAVDNFSDMLIELNLSHYDSREIDVVVVDPNGGESFGYEAVRSLRAQGYDLPVIAYSPNNRPGDERAAIEAGCDVFVDKGHGLQRLIEQIARLTSVNQ